MRFALESEDFKKFLSLQVWSLDAGFMWASRFNHWTQVSYVHWCLSFSTLTFFLVFMILILCSSFLQWGILWVLWRRGITLATLTVLTPMSFQPAKGNLCIHRSKQGMTSPLDWQLLKKPEFFFRDGIKEGEEDLYNRDYNGFLGSGPLWSIIDLHQDNVGHDAPIWS